MATEYRDVIIKAVVELCPSGCPANVADRLALTISLGRVVVTRSNWRHSSAGCRAVSGFVSMRPLLVGVITRNARQ